ncbi:hypothetical protein GCM10023074_48460 [Microbispora amethystogenes]|uniref:Uncharacterized protein n=1 Tax=Microbispora amethystogenes TaxID=1427754 RepID=A0ABQ4FFS4_9ACTN|nr:hypothetical protein Mam01_38310 [Microbispora amethystogenes]
MTSRMSVNPIGLPESRSRSAALSTGARRVRVTAPPPGLTGVTSIPAYEGEPVLEEWGGISRSA